MRNAPRLTLPKLMTGVAAVFMLSTCFMLLAPSPKASAISGSDFDPGHIIDDDIFTNSAAMSVQEIQNFLNSKVPTCDTNGSQLTSHSNGSGGYYTRAQWGALYDSQHNTTIAAAPYVCLKDYVENPSTGQNNLQNPGASIAGGQTAAQIIYNAGAQYHISSKVILTTLQKEQGIVTDDWPWVNEYQAAMGYDCPDSGSGCNSAYSGFAKQVNSAAQQFRYYLDHPGAFNYWLGYNKILYNPNTACGSSIVNIVNRATAALYIYTPYQPNQAALNNLTGSGDSCSAYGNRNFWYRYNVWFGSTLEATDVTDASIFQTRTKTLTFNGQIYVLYYDAFQRTISVGTQNNSTGKWEFSVLDGISSGGGGRVDASLGSDISATVYNNTLQVFYYDKTHGALRHAWLDTSWHFETLDGNLGSVSGRSANVGINVTSAVFDTSLQLFYYDRTYGNLRHAWADATGWHFENLDGDAGSIARHTSDVGMFSTTLQYSTSLQLFYYDVSAGNLRHAWTDSEGWHFENLDGDAGSIARFDSNVGVSPAAINYGGSIQLYYYDNAQGNLRHAWTTNTGWHFENLDGDSGSISRLNTNIGLNPTVTEYNGSLQLYYYENGNGNLRHAWTTNTGWHFENLDGDSGSIAHTSGDMGLNPSVTVYNGSLQLYYLDRTDGTLRHAWTDNTGWHFEDLVSVVVY